MESPALCDACASVAGHATADRPAGHSLPAADEVMMVPPAVMVAMVMVMFHHHPVVMPVMMMVMRCSLGDAGEAERRQREAGDGRDCPDSQHGSLLFGRASPPTVFPQPGS